MVADTSYSPLRLMEAVCESLVAEFLFPQGNVINASYLPNLRELAVACRDRLLAEDRVAKTAV